MNLKIVHTEYFKFMERKALTDKALREFLGLRKYSLSLLWQKLHNCINLSVDLLKFVCKLWFEKLILKCL